MGSGYWLARWGSTVGNIVPSDICVSHSLLDIKYLSPNRTGAGRGIGNLLLITVRGAGNGLLGIYHVYTRTRVSRVQQVIHGELFIDSDFIFGLSYLGSLKIKNGFLMGAKDQGKHS